MWDAVMPWGAVLICEGKGVGRGERERLKRPWKAFHGLHTFVRSVPGE